MGMIREIQTFLSICDGGTFAAAAEQMGITQSAVSAQIKNLEKHLGFPLFDRNRRGAILSEQGEQILPLARQIAILFAQMSDASTQTAFSGSLKIGILPALQNAVLPELLARLPETPRLHIAPHAALLDGLRQKNWDVAILVRPNAPLPPDCVAHTLRHDPCFLLSKNDVHHQNILLNAPILAYENSAFGNDNLAHFFRQQGCAQPILSSDDASALISLVKNGVGVAVLPQSCLNDVADLARLPVPVSRELVAVSLHENAAQAEMLAQTWQQVAAPNAPSWQQAHNAKNDTFSLSNMRVSRYFRA